MIKSVNCFRQNIIILQRDTLKINMYYGMEISNIFLVKGFMIYLYSINLFMERMV